MPRVFCAINLPEKTRKELNSFRDEYPDLPLRWTKRDNLHLTLLFLGYVNDEELLDVCRLAREVGKRHAPFTLSLKRIIFGPPKKNPPRLIWAEGQVSEELSRLQKDLEGALFENVRSDPDEAVHGFAPHVTLGRIKQWQWHQLEPEEIPEIDKEIALTFAVESIEVMESELKKEGPEYHVLESIPLSP